MVVQVYKNTKKNDIIIINKSHLSEKEIPEGYKLIEEIEGKDWDECNKKINSKHFNSKFTET
jgi:hypothetical protein